VASSALAAWRGTCLPRLDELERVHQSATGPGPGRRWGTQQLNRSLFVVLVAQFQIFCRDLHDEAVDLHTRHANPRQATLLRTLLTQGRKVETGNPRTAALGSDFGRLGFKIIESVGAVSPRASDDLHRLDMLTDFRNAIVHGNETEITALTEADQIKATKTTYRRYRRSLERLAGTMDSVVAAKMAAELDLSELPW
jgi:hypothetical protein